MRKFLTLPSLGGRLAIVYLLLWVIIGFLARGQMLPGQVMYWIEVILSFPLVTYLIPTTGPGNELGLVFFVAVIVINSYVWGYGVSWIWQEVIRFGKK